MAHSCASPGGTAAGKGLCPCLATIITRRTGGTVIMKILAVCGMGVGSALLLRMLVEKALRNLDLQAELEIADISTARGAGADADIIVTSAELAERLGQVSGKIVTIKNYIDVDEMTEKLRTAISQET
jgi:PTS system ascorbate-specific IIB component